LFANDSQRGRARGAEWDVYPGDGTLIRDATCGVGGGDMIYMHGGTYEEWASGSPEKFMGVPGAIALEMEDQFVIIEAVPSRDW